MADTSVPLKSVPFTRQVSRTYDGLGGVVHSFFDTEAPGQTPSQIWIDKKDLSKLEADIPGVLGVLREIHARLFPGMILEIKVDRSVSRGSSKVVNSGKVDLVVNPSMIKLELGTGDAGKTKILHTLFHELSHPIESVYLKNLPANQFADIVKQYVKTRNMSALQRAGLLSSLMSVSKGATGAEDPAFRNRLMQELKINEADLKAYMRSTDKRVTPGASQASNELSFDYYRSFTEWVAEQGAAWLSKEAQGLVPRTAMQKFQKDILDRLRELFENLRSLLGLPARAGAFEKMMKEVYGNRRFVEADPSYDVSGPDIIPYNRPTGNYQGVVGTGQPPKKAPKKPKAIPEARTLSEETALPAGSTAQPPANVQAIQDKIFAGAKESKGRFRQFVDTVQDMYKQGGWQALADGFSREAVDKYIMLKRLDERYVAAMKKLGNSVAAAFDDRFALAARNSAHASMLDRENVLAKVNTMLMQGGVPVYKVLDPKNPLDGVIKIEGAGKGLSFLADLQKSGKLRSFAEYAVAKRVLGSYQKRGLEFQITPAEAQALVDLHEADPDIVQAYKDYQETNKALIKLAVDSGRVSKDNAEALLEFNDYYPFYRDVDEAGRYTGPTNAKGLLDPARIQQAKGGAELLQEDPVDVILKNVQFWIGASQKNIAARKIYTMSQALGEGRQLSFTKEEQAALQQAQFNGDEKAARAYVQRERMLRPGEMEGSYFVDGVERRIALSNPDVAEALLVTEGSVPDLFKGIFGTFTTGYRELVTRSPEYIISNVIRDAASQWVTSGVSFNPLRSISNVAAYMKDKENNDKILALMQYGVIGGYKSVPELDDASKLMNPNFNPTRGGIYVPKSGRALSNIISKVWNNLGELSDASDAAPRAEIYRKVLEETGDEYEAAFRAQEAMNYRKQGRSTILKYLTVMVPFINGRIQGLDVTARAFGPKAIGYTMIKGSYLFGVAMALQALFGDDDEYKQLPEYVRYGSLPIPLKALGLGDTGFLAIPKPFEMGFIFQTVPEVIYQAMLGNVETRNLTRLVGEQLSSTFGLSITPQVISPIVETFVQNRSNLTGLPIVTEAMKNLPKELQFTASTSDIVKDVAGAMGISPVRAEALIKGYTGQIGTSILGMVDGLYRGTTGSGVDKDWTQYPVIQKFLKSEANTNPQGVSDVYRLSAEIQGLTTALNTFIAQGSADKARDLMEKNPGLFAMKSTISGLRTQLNNLSRQERMIRNNDNIDQETKERQVEAIRQARRAIGKIMTDSIENTGK